MQEADRSLCGSGSTGNILTSIFFPELKLRVSLCTTVVFITVIVRLFYHVLTIISLKFQLQT